MHSSEAFSHRLLIRCCVAILLVSLNATRLVAQSAPDQAASEQAALARNADGEALRVLEAASVAAIEKAGRSVVAIARVEKRLAARAPYTGSLASLQDPNDLRLPPQYFGTGIICSSDGHIVTCAHVLGDPRLHDYYVSLDHQTYRAQPVFVPGNGDTAAPNPGQRDGESSVAARVLASDAFSDLAVLKIDAKDLKPIEYGNADEIRRGQFVFLLGNPDAIARDGIASASWGVIANLDRRAPEVGADEPLGPPSTMHGYGTLLQVDTRAPVGTSGGALVNLDGQLLGIMTSLVSRAGTGRAGGLAIPADETLQRIVERMKTGRLPEFGFLGVQPADLRAADRELGHQGVLVQSVIEGLPGARAGIRAQDIITQVNAASIRGRDDLLRELSRAAANEDVMLFVARRGRPADAQLLRVKLGKRPAAATAGSYASAAPKPWRGITVDYISALPTELLGGKLNGSRASAKIAVTRVEPGSDGWRAGVRPGDAILSVLGSPMETPDAFYAFTLSMLGKVGVSLADVGGQKRQIEISQPM